MSDLLDYAALERTPVDGDPFRHVTVPGFVPPAALREVVAGLPGDLGGGSYPVEALKLGPTAQAMVRELQGPRFRALVAGKFGLDLRDAPCMVTLRGQSREKDGRIHRDSRAKRVTVLLYLNPASESWARREGCLRLLRGGSDLEDYAEEVPPTDGALLVFPNGPGTWHGHRTYVGRRFVVQLNYMTTDGEARREMRRHRVSAWGKRWFGRWLG